jgi:hypothetical protein
MKMALCFCGFLPIKPITQPNNERNIRVPIEVLSIKYLVNSPQTVRVNKGKEKPEKLSQSRGD